MAAPERPFSEVLSSIFGNVQDMVHAEMRLAAAQAREELAKATRGVAWFAVGIATALFALAFGLVAIFYALLPLVPNWAAALIIAGALALLSAIAIAIGAGQRKDAATARQASKTKLYQEELPWAKQPVR